MRVLLDTHVIIWWTMEAHKIGSRVTGLLQAPATEIFVSPVSAWEIAYKHSLGKLDFPSAVIDDFDQWIQRLHWAELPFTAKHAVVSARLGGLHKDPFDRMLAGQAKIEGLQLISADPAFKHLGVEALW